MTLNDIKLKSFLDKYGCNYNAGALEYIMDNFEDYLPSGRGPDVLMQIYSELGITEENKDIYKGFIKLMSDNFSFNRNILEIGGGFYPIMSKYIDQRQQQLRQGSITCYDPNLVTTSLGKIKLFKKCFDEEQSVKQYNLIVGTLPCEATQLIVRKANEENKEFFLALCGCTHFSNAYLQSNRPTSTDWINHVYETAMDTLDEDAKIDIEYLADSYEFEYPILIKKYKNR